jgi:hypothetical protein
MNIDTKHLHYWMQAIRQSPDPMRTMDAFWEGQLKSKEWLISTLFNPNIPWPRHIPFGTFPLNIDIHGGWTGLLASMLFQWPNAPIQSIRSLDIDPACEEIACMMNKGEEMQGKFSAITADMCTIEKLDFFKTNLVINTSVEHLTPHQYDQWLHRIPYDTILVLQSNNYHIDEHVNPVESLEEFQRQSMIRTIWAGELELPLYKRFMIIGKL